VSAEGEKVGILRVERSCFLEMPELLKILPISFEGESSHLVVELTPGKKEAKQHHGKTAPKPDATEREKEISSREKTRLFLSREDFGHRIGNRERGERDGGHHREDGEMKRKIEEGGCADRKKKGEIPDDGGQMLRPGEETSRGSLDRLKGTEKSNAEAEVEEQHEKKQGETDDPVVGQHLEKFIVDELGFSHMRAELG
jgi:hypothetical protein